MSGRQSSIVVKEKRYITKTKYSEMNDVAMSTALRDINELVSMGILKKRGDGKNTQYVF